MVDSKQKDLAVAADTISIDPAVAFGGGVFTICGSVTSGATISKVEISASVDGGAVQVLGNANVNPDGSFTFSDGVGTHTQSSITATVYDSLGGTASVPATYQLMQPADHPNLGVQIRFAPNDTAQTNPTSRFTFDGNGTETVYVLAPNQTFYSVRDDTFRNMVMTGTTFVFGQNYFVDQIAGFVVGPTGHDVISLPGQDFGFSKAEVFSNTTDPNGSAIITDPVTKDEIVVSGILKSSLVANAADIVLRAPCFCSHTQIRTSRGEIEVEDLAVGDLVTTTSGALRPVRWLGSRTIDCRAHPRPHDVHPVRIRAGAFGLDADGEAVPARELRLSPGHPVLVGSGPDEVLVPIMCLINGTSIARRSVDFVTYWHVELEGAHDILLAEGLPAESYLDWGDRAFFDEASDHALHNPDHVVPGLAARCRPVAIDGPLVEAERRRLDAVFAVQLAKQGQWDKADAFAWLA